MPEGLRIVIPGGSGQVGTVLARAFHALGHRVAILGRGAPGAGPWRHARWDGRTLGRWTEELEGADVLINLCGRSVNCRYGARNRREILDSRVIPTRLLGEAMRTVARPPRLWLQAGTATIYAPTYGPANDEATGRLDPAGPDLPDTWRFSVGIARAWEAAALAAAPPGVRLVLLRTSLVMNPDRGSVFDVLFGLVRRGLGGAQGDGRQYVSWIHESDFTAAILWLIAHPEVSGPVNLAAPGPLPNAGFMAALRRAGGVRLGLPAPAWLLEIGAVLLRTETELILKSRRVAPGILTRGGFEFRYPDWEGAAWALCQEWRLTHPPRRFPAA